MVSTHQGSVHDALEKSNPGMALVFGALVSVAVERIGCVSETGVSPGGDAARGERRRVWEMEVWETGVECAFRGNVPAESDVVDTSEGEIGLPFETLDVGAEADGGVARGCNGEGGQHDVEAGWDGDGGVRVEGEAGQESGDDHRCG